MLGLMDAAAAIADLTEISPQVRDVVAVAADGAVIGSNLGDPAAAERLAGGAHRLLEAAEELRPGVQRLRRPRRRAHDCGYDDTRADGRPRVLRPEDLPALDRGAEEARPEAQDAGEAEDEGRRCRGVRS
jgi:hypothetical protein